MREGPPADAVVLFHPTSWLHGLGVFFSSVPPIDRSRHLSLAASHAESASVCRRRERKFREQCARASATRSGRTSRAAPWRGDYHDDEEDDGLVVRVCVGRGLGMSRGSEVLAALVLAPTGPGRARAQPTVWAARATPPPSREKKLQLKCDGGARARRRADVIGAATPRVAHARALDFEVNLWFRRHSQSKSRPVAPETAVNP